ncbi:type II toxin-antitoxin system RelE/ParE family toxin [Deferribacterales bacterium RsTz2092]|nr:toxin RelE [Deferribacterales bacterium]
MWEIEFYKTAEGKEVIADFLDTLPTKHRAKVLWEVDLLATYGTALSMPYTRHIEGKLWELRIKFASDISRIFYFVLQGNKIVLLHGFVKKTDKVSQGEIDRAKEHLNDYERRCLNEL